MDIADIDLMYELRNFLDEEGKLKKYPTKYKLKIFSLFYIASKLERGVRYTEKQLNKSLCEWHTFEDWAVLRRDLYDKRFMDREPNGAYYWMEDTIPTLSSLGLE